MWKPVGPQECRNRTANIEISSAFARSRRRGQVKEGLLIENGIAVRTGANALRQSLFAILENRAISCHACPLPARMPAFAIHSFEFFAGGGRNRGY